MVAMRFSGLEQLAKALIATVSDLKRLEVLVIDLSAATSREEAQQRLLSLVSAA